MKNRKADKAAAATGGTHMTGKGKGLFGFRRRKAATNDSNTLPHHPSPDQARDVEKAHT